MSLSQTTRRRKPKQTGTTMDADPSTRLSFLYKNDPFYSLCLSDLMTAPQQTQNKFLKEQKKLTMTIKKLEHQKLTRLRQLNEEKRQFSLLVRKRLVPTIIVRRGSYLTTERGSQTVFSSVKFSSLASSKSSCNSLEANSGSKAASGFPSTTTQDLPGSRASKFCKVSELSFPGAGPANISTYLHSKQLLTRRKNYLPLLSQAGLRHSP